MVFVILKSGWTNEADVNFQIAIDTSGYNIRNVIFFYATQRLKHVSIDIMMNNQ